MIELSIVVPIYNVEKYLEECLESIYNLKIKKEIILVNDESPDNSALIIEKYKKLYPNETVVITQKNKGLSGARNSGLEMAKGEYIAFIDSDDFINTKEYEKFFYKGKNKKLDIIIGTYKKYKDGEYLQTCKKINNIEFLGEVTGKEFFQKTIKYDNFYVEVWDDIFLREFLIKNNLKFKEKLLHEDILFTVQAFSKAMKVEYFEMPIYTYRQRGGSITSMFNEKNSQHQLWIINELIKFEKQDTIKLSGIGKISIDLLWNIFRKTKYTNVPLLNKLIFKEIYSTKIYIKVILMYISSLKYKKLKKITL